LDISGGPLAWHHEGPFDAASLARNRQYKNSPIEAVAGSNAEALKATAEEKINDSLRRQRPLDGVALVPPGEADRNGRVYTYRAGTDLMIEDGGNYKRWDHVKYLPEDLKGKGEPSYSIEKALKEHKAGARDHRRIMSDGQPASSYEMTTPRARPRRPDMQARSSSYGSGTTQLQQQQSHFLITFGKPLAMRSAAKLFYLAVFALFHPSHALGPARSDRYASAEHCAVRSDDSTYPSSTISSQNLQINPKAIVSDACVSYSTLDNLNTALSSSLKDITQSTDFFAYYRLNLYDQKCPVRAWDDETGTCGNIACKVDTLEDEKDIPEIWRASELSKLEGPKAAHPGRQQQAERGSQRPLQGTLGENVGESCVVEYDDECDERDYCIPEDESATAKGDYVSLVDNPERYTGYAGQPVWDAIYRENCFFKSPPIPNLSSSFPPATNPFGNNIEAANALRNVIQAGSAKSEFILDDECLEKRVFHRIIS
ncbi:MAG: hypothetical protein Q9183_005566, partial [Haloplaca sp. 2 TL-2023]